MDKLTLAKNLIKKGQEKGYFTLDEIKNQYTLWEDTYNLYLEKKTEVEAFIDEIKQKHGQVHVIFTGAGTSNYVGDVVLPHVQYKHQGLFFSSIPTTDLVSNPREFFNPHMATLLVSFARSGNSPESVAAVKLGKQVVPNFYQLNITCAKEGKLALNSAGDKDAYLFLLNEKCNDRGFAMTSSYTCMTLASLLIFGNDAKASESYLKTIVAMAKEVNERLAEIIAPLSTEQKRVVYLGSGALGKLTREAQLKILELTAGQLATCFDSSMGFRHGPKSFLDTKTLVVDFISNNSYTQQYDNDIINEICADGIAHTVYTIETKQNAEHEKSPAKSDKHTRFIFQEGKDLPDAYLALPCVMLAQYLAAYAAIMVDNHVDSPSQSGTVNRVVQGVIIHELEN